MLWKLITTILKELFKKKEEVDIEFNYKIPKFDFQERIDLNKEEKKMKVFQLKRVAYISDGTFGVLLDDGVPFCLTLERLWRNNECGKSCIPTGIYICKRIQSPKFGNTFEITEVVGRSHILFHKGNLADDSHGCILLGEQYEFFESKNAILASGKAFKEFLFRTINIDVFYLEIKSCK